MNFVLLWIYGMNKEFEFEFEFEPPYMTLKAIVKLSKRTTPNFPPTTTAGLLRLLFNCALRKQVGW
jgi:hypothetical protein